MKGMSWKDHLKRRFRNWFPTKYLLDKKKISKLSFQLYPPLAIKKERSLKKKEEI